MKKILIAILLLITVSVSAQPKPAKDTTAVPDSVAIVSVNDMVSALKYLEDKVTKKEYDYYQKAYLLLVQMNEQKRKNKQSKK